MQAKIYRKNYVKNGIQYFGNEPLSKCRLTIWFATFWILTNDPEGVLKQLFEVFEARYLHGQYEQGEKEKDNAYEGKHLQFTVHLKRNQLFVWLNNKLKDAKLPYKIHWQGSEGPAAEGYVSKGFTRIAGPWEFGQKPKILKMNEQKKEKKITISEGMKMSAKELFDHYGVLQYRKVTDFLVNAKVRFDDTNLFKARAVFYVWGRPGFGKSTFVKYIIKTHLKREFQKISFKKSGIDNEEGFWSIKPEILETDIKIGLFEEFRERNCGMARLMELVDYDITSLNVKHGDRLNEWQVIFITTVEDPSKLYDNIAETKFDGRLGQLLKRFDCIIQLKEDWKKNYKKKIEEGEINPLDILKKNQMIDFFDDKIVAPEERENNVFDIDTMSWKEFVGLPSDDTKETKEKEIQEAENKEEIEDDIVSEHPSLIDDSEIRTPQMSFKQDEEENEITKYFIFSRKSEERESFAENMIGAEYNQIVFNDGNYYGDDWDSDIAVLKMNNKIPIEDFQGFIFDQTPSFKTRKGIKKPKLRYFFILSYDSLINLYPESDVSKSSWYNHLKVIDLDVSAKKKFSSMNDALNNFILNFKKKLFNLVFN